MRASDSEHIRADDPVSALAEMAPKRRTMEKSLISHLVGMMHKLDQAFGSLFSKNDIAHDPMKYLIVGLGNIGAKYEGTRHNVGFEVVDHLAQTKEVSWTTDNLGDVAQFKHRGRTYILLKPSTYMNRSGKSVRYWLQKEKIEKNNMLVILDDLNLPFGKQRLRGKGSDGGHNGLKDIDQMTGGNDYARLRFGIGDEFSKGQQVDFVLGEWSTEEKKTLPELIKYAGDTALSFGAIGLNHTMNTFNKK
jgi:PTH1 family peptidyl-tRNA hydrolase